MHTAIGSLHSKLQRTMQLAEHSQYERDIASQNKYTSPLNKTNHGEAFVIVLQSNSVRDEQTLLSRGANL